MLELADAELELVDFVAETSSVVAELRSARRLLGSSLAATHAGRIGEELAERSARRPYRRGHRASCAALPAFSRRAGPLGGRRLNHVDELGRRLSGEPSSDSTSAGYLRRRRRLPRGR